VWSLCLNSEQDLLLTGSNEGELKAWKIDPSALVDGVKELKNGEVRYYDLNAMPCSHAVSFTAV
jgi:hypothetical protein